MSVNTSGGAYVGGNVNPERDFIGRDQIIIQTDNHFYTNGVTPHHPPLPLPSILDPAPMQQSWTGIARAAELSELDAWYETVTADKRGAQPRLALITGAKGSGKRDLLRYWQTTLLKREVKPIVAATSYLPRSIQRAEQENYYSAHPGWNEAWARYANLLRSRYRHTETLGGPAWVALAAQLVQQSANAATLLTQSEPLVDDRDLSTIRRRMSDLLLAALADGPLVLVLEAVDQAQFTVLEPLLQAWRTVLHDLPCLLLLVVDTPFALHPAESATQSNDWFTWLCEQTAPPAPKAHYLHVGPLRVNGVAALLTEDSQAFAPALHYATGGAPAVVQTLLHHAQQQEQATRTADGRWQLQASAFSLSAGKLYQELIIEPLQACAARAQELGFTVTWETLLRWLNHAVWEGETFTDEALAYAVEMHGEALTDFQELLDEVLVRRDGEPGMPSLLVELEETIAVYTGNPDSPKHHMALYKFEPPLLAGLLYNRQHGAERIRYGSRYLDGLVKAYQSSTEMIAPTLVEICRTLGKVEEADRFLRSIAPPDEIAHAEATLAAMRAFAATEPAGQLQLVRYVIEFVKNAQRKVNPRSLLLLLIEALDYAQQLNLIPIIAHLLQNIGECYHRLGELEQAMKYYNQAIPLRRRTGDRFGEADAIANMGHVYADLGNKEKALVCYTSSQTISQQIGYHAGQAITLHGIGRIYFDLNDNRQALVYFSQALTLKRQISDQRSEAATLSAVGAVYLRLGHNQQALVYLTQALHLRRQFNDHSGEAFTLGNIGDVHAALGDQQRALTYYHQALSLHQQIGNKNGEASSLNNIGSTYFDLGDQQEALSYFNRALLLTQLVGNRWYEAITHNNMAWAYQALGDLDTAETQLRKAVTLGEALNHPALAQYRQALVELQALRRQGVVDAAGQ